MKKIEFTKNTKTGLIAIIILFLIGTTFYTYNMKRFQNIIDSRSHQQTITPKKDIVLKEVSTQEMIQILRAEWQAEHPNQKMPMPVHIKRNPNIKTDLDRRLGR